MHVELLARELHNDAEELCVWQLRASVVGGIVGEHVECSPVLGSVFARHENVSVIVPEPLNLVLEVSVYLSEVDGVGVFDKSAADVSEVGHSRARVDAGDAGERSGGCEKMRVLTSFYTAGGANLWDKCRAIVVRRWAARRCHNVSKVR